MEKPVWQKQDNNRDSEAWTLQLSEQLSMLLHIDRTNGLCRIAWRMLYEPIEQQEKTEPKIWSSSFYCMDAITDDLKPETLQYIQCTAMALATRWTKTSRAQSRQIYHDIQMAARCTNIPCHESEWYMPHIPDRQASGLCPVCLWEKILSDGTLLRLAKTDPDCDWRMTAYRLDGKITANTLPADMPEAMAKEKIIQWSGQNHDPKQTITEKGDTTMPDINNRPAPETEHPHACIGIIGDHQRFYSTDLMSIIQKRNDLQRAKYMIDAGVEPEEAAEKNHLSMDELAEVGIIQPVEQEYVVPVTYAVAGFLVVKADSAEHAIRAVIDSVERQEMPALLEPEIQEDTCMVSTDTEIVNVFSGLHRKNTFKNPVTPTNIRYVRNNKDREPKTRPEKTKETSGEDTDETETSDK